MNNSGGAGVASQNRAYQGYPYVNPVVLDIPSIDAVAAARYTALPRRPWMREEEPSGSQSNASQQPSAGSSKQVEESPSKADPDDNPPVVYIDMPESNGSDVAERRRVENDGESFVQETIFYDPFKGRHIGVARSNSESSTVSADESSEPTSSRRIPPNTLDLGSANGGPSTSQCLPSSYSKETSIYGSSIAPTDYQGREPPPAYTETDLTSPSPTATTPGPIATSPVTDESPSEPNRTQVIIPPAINPDRKMLFCKYCGIRSHTLVVRQPGFYTHFMAIFFGIFGLLPLTILIYCSDVFKYKNHHCNNCSKKIAYEIPMCCCMDINHVT